MSRKKSNKKKRSSDDNPIIIRPLKLWQDSSYTQEVRLELLPLIDVIFCILTFFILAAVTFSRQQAISLDLPTASTGTPQTEEMLIVSLDNLGQVYIEKQFVTRKKLKEVLQNYRLFNPNGLMVLHAAKDARYSEVVEILDILREVGGDRVALATVSGETGKMEPNVPVYPSPDPLLPNLPNTPQP